MGILRHRKPHNEKEVDVEAQSGETAVDESGDNGKSSLSSPSSIAVCGADLVVSVVPDFQGDEIEKLLSYVEYEAKRSKRGGDDDDKEEEVKYKRVWYAPWKKQKIDGNGAQKVRFSLPSHLVSSNRLLIASLWLNSLLP